jgi:hypothetical protein
MSQEKLLQFEFIKNQAWSSSHTRQASMLSLETSSARDNTVPCRLKKEKVFKKLNLLSRPVLKSQIHTSQSYIIQDWKCPVRMCKRKFLSMTSLLHHYPSHRA